MRNMDTVANKLKTLRGARSMKEVAQSVGISVSALGMYETGRRVPKDSIKKKIANYYGKTVGEIFFN